MTPGPLPLYCLHWPRPARRIRRRPRLSFTASARKKHPASTHQFSLVILVLTRTIYLEIADATLYKIRNAAALADSAADHFRLLPRAGDDRHPRHHADQAEILFLAQMAGRHRARAGLHPRAVAQGEHAAAAPGQYAGVAEQGRRRHARAALHPDLRRAAVGLLLHLRGRRAGGLPRPVPAAVADRSEPRTETAAQGSALLADHDHGRPRRRPCAGRAEAPLHRPRRRPETHAAQSLNHPASHLTRSPT